jgi:hypothetical protein
MSYSISRAWLWLVENDVLVLIFCNLAALACGLVLGVHSVIVTRRVTKLARAMDKLNAVSEPMQAAAEPVSADLRFINSAAVVNVEVRDLAPAVPSLPEPQFEHGVRMEPTALTGIRGDLVRLRQHLADGPAELPPDDVPSGQ